MNKKYLVTTLIENKCFPVAPTAFCTKVSAEAEHPDTLQSAQDTDLRSLLVSSSPCHHNSCP